MEREGESRAPKDWWSEVVRKTVTAQWFCGLTPYCIVTHVEAASCRLAMVPRASPVQIRLEWQFGPSQCKARIADRIRFGVAVRRSSLSACRSGDSGRMPLLQEKRYEKFIYALLICVSPCGIRHCVGAVL